MIYSLPKLPYDYQELEPYISEEQLKLHHQKHHQAYVNSANALLEKLDKARKDNADIDIKATLKELSFQVGGHVLHSLFWRNLKPGKQINEKLKSAIEKEFGSFERFKKEFTQAATGVEGSGWAALAADETGKLLILQIEKHNVNIYPGFRLLLVLDVWEHAYYLDYKNNRAGFVDAFWNIVNWDEVEKRFKV
jgi:Fe-Mn family superoxide dismutase